MGVSHTAMNLLVHMDKTAMGAQPVGAVNLSNADAAKYTNELDELKAAGYIEPFKTGRYSEESVRTTWNVTKEGHAKAMTVQEDPNSPWTP